DFHADDIPVVDYQQRVLMPGIVDSHVHINEPGRTDWEGFDTATHAAAAGGITTVVDMPLNCIPVTITAQALQEKLAVLDDKLWIDAGFWGGATADNLGELPDLLDAGVLGVKSFTIHSGIDEFQFVNETQLTDAMRELAKRGMPHLVHAELDHAHSEPMSIASSYQSFLKTRPPAWENDAIAMVIRVMKALIAEGLQPHAHIVHLSSAEALPMIQQARADGLNLTVETCPHYLVLEAETIPDGQATYKCCPPIRERSNQDLLWQALLDGTIDCVVSDHSPCTPQLKNIDSGDLEKAWGGISGLQFGLPLLWTHAQDKGMSLTQLSELMSARPARLTGLTNKGSIANGQQAAFCVFDPDGQCTVTPEIIHHRHKISPYVGKTLQGVVVATLLAGQTIYQQGEFVGSARGRALLKEAVQ
ncbi:MAG: allantoinase AllB, partial [Reinekea sp.]|nr:allantoinase AllB [Reinekea sp.]